MAHGPEASFIFYQPQTERKRGKKQEQEQEQEQDLTPNPMLAIPTSIAHVEPVPAPKEVARQESEVSKAKPEAKPVSSKLAPIPTPRSSYQVRRASQTPPKPASAVPETCVTPPVLLAQLATTNASGSYSFTGARVSFGGKSLPTGDL